MSGRTFCHAQPRQLQKVMHADVEGAGGGGVPVTALPLEAEAALASKNECLAAQLGQNKLNKHSLGF